MTINELAVTYQDYADPVGKIHRQIKKQTLFPLVKGLYETDPKTPGLYLTAYIYGPSYVSFEYALSFHGLIPERVNVFTSATFDKRKSKKYTNHFGVFHYRDVPKAVYPFDIQVHEASGYVYFIASPEKAVCDQLYIAPPQTSMKRIKTLLFEDLRIDPEEFSNLDGVKMGVLAEKYPSKNLKLLRKWLQKGNT